MSYDKIQFIGYTLNTGPKFLGAKKYYVGLDVEFEDISARLAWTRYVVQQAAAGAEKSARTLKLLMLPEFYFRGARGAYSMDIVATLIAGLQDLVGDKEWEHWMFVFGTIVGVSSPTNYEPWRPPPEDRTPIDTSRSKTVYNFALTQKGGWSPSGGELTPEQRNKLLDDKAFVTMKEYKSDQDFIFFDDFILTTAKGGSAGYMWERVMHLDQDEGGVSHRSRFEGREERIHSYDGASLFELDGIQFGLEICLDHPARRLKNSPRPPGSREVQIHLVPSCGMDLKPAAIVAQTGGYAFNVDGTGPGTSQLARVKRAYTLTEPDAELEPDIKPPSPIVLEDTPQRLFAYGSGSLAIYDAVDIPDTGSGSGERAGRTGRTSRR